MTEKPLADILPTLNSLNREVPEPPFASLDDNPSAPPRDGLREALKSSQAFVQFIGALRKIPYDLRTLRGKMRRPAMVRSYFDSHEVRKMQIGTGNNPLEGWLNTDINPHCAGVVYMDGTRRFPFEDGSFDFIFSEHVIEHIPYQGGYHLLSECYRVLKPGGRLRLATPNLERIAQLVIDRDNDANREYIGITVEKHIPGLRSHEPAFVVNNFFWDFGHYFVFDPDAMRLTLESIGFENVAQFPPGKSDDPVLDGIESHGNVVGDIVNQFETMVFEGRKAE